MESELGRRSVLMGGGAAIVGTAAAVGASMISATPAAAEPIVPIYYPIGPERVYDSRTIGDNIIRNETRTLFAGEIDPSFYWALNFNLTIVGTVGSSGWLSLFPGDIAWPGSSTINWTGTGQTLANNAFAWTAVSDGSIKVRCGGNTGASTHFILDVTAALIPEDVGATAATAFRAPSPSGSSGLDNLKRLQDTLRA
jgi:hypothetical protein